MHRRTFLVGAAAASAAVAGCTGNPTDGGTNGATTEDPVVDTKSVAMTASQFEPRNIAVDVGVNVTWTNEDDYPHTVTSASDNWSKDADVAAGGSTAHTFDDDGVYHVYCELHGEADLSGMSMKVGVGDATIQNPLGVGNDDGGMGY